MVMVKFTAHWGSYNIGEGAGFSEAKAQALVDRGVATYLHAAVESPVSKGEVVESSAAEPEAPKPKKRGRPKKAPVTED